MDKITELFLPPVAQWFCRSLGEPTPVQRQGWPAIRAGQNTLLLAPTGSGKTLAAFLACLDGLWRQQPIQPGVQILYVSPLKALNNDIYRNLQAPLEGAARAAEDMGFTLPKIDAAVRTGDTTTAERIRLVRNPPHVLITTPESLHLLLTSKARDTLRNVTHCIVDEIHALCPNKRGVFLSLLLERLEAIVPRGFVRVGLSATQRPLDEVARYLGGADRSQDGQYISRPVTIVDAGLRKNLDLKVVSPVEHFGAIPERSIWPSIYRLLAEEISRHRSTIVFANNRRSVERITAQLQELLESGEVADQEHNVVFPLADGDAPPRTAPTRTAPRVKAHHGSVALEVRQEAEEALKDGRLQAVVATASLELGIDMGMVDLVFQVESTGNVARALQRVGRAGHLVGSQSKGRLIAKTPADLIDQAVLAAEMAAGRVEEIRTPQNCLDVLAQQVIAMVAMDSWDVEALYRLVRQSYAYHDLTPKAFDAVLEMVSGRYRFGQGEDAGMRPAQQLSALQPRISWDRVHNRLEALPGSQRLALVGGGTIPDTGQYAVVTERGLRLGEVDEEFVYERRIGDAFLLGTHAWRVEEINVDRVVVRPAENAPAMIPFWRGESTGRTHDLGRAQGRFLRELAARLDGPDCLEWLEHEHFLDPAAARNVRRHVRRQIERTGVVPSDRTIVIETSRDPLGDWQVIALSPWGSRLHFTLRLALENILRERLGYRPQAMHHDDGILLRLTDSDEPVLDLFTGLTPENLKRYVLDELGDSSLFALRFRQNAARALLMPRGQANKRAPLWLQRLRGKDLLQVARQFPDFPVAAETFRECLHDHLDLPHLEQLLADVHSGAIEVRTCRLEAPSPFAAGLLFAFNAAFQYEYDATEGSPGRDYSRLDHELLDQLVARSAGDLTLNARAVAEVDRRLRGLGEAPRTKAEMAERLRRLGDISPTEAEEPMANFLHELESDGRVEQVSLPRVAEPNRWVLTEDAAAYRSVFGASSAPAPERQNLAATILARFLETHALVSLQDVLARYPFEPDWARRQLEAWCRSGRAVSVPTTTAASGEVESKGRAEDHDQMQWSAPENLRRIQRGTLAIQRRAVVTCAPTQFADFALHWQKLHSTARDNTSEGLGDVLEQLEGLAISAELWEQALLPARFVGYQPRWLDEQMDTGNWLWIGRGTEERGAGSLRFIRRESVSEMAPPATASQLTADEQVVFDCLSARGALHVPELAQYVGLPPGRVRAALWSLVRGSLATNDRFDAARRGETRPVEAQAVSAASARRPARSLMRPRGAGRRGFAAAEGRWSLVGWRHPDRESVSYAQARLLLRRHGIAARELALMDDAMPPWRVLYEILSRLELSGEVRRGYFVEGLSGAQFALPDAARLLGELNLPSKAGQPPILLHSLDPANMYGAGAPFDIPLLDGGTRPFTRREGNWLVQAAGRPILLIEQHGKRLTALPSAAPEEIATAVSLLPQLLRSGMNGTQRHKLTVETWNDAPVASSPARAFLEGAGFVRDYQAMTLYEAWR